MKVRQKMGRLGLVFAGVLFSSLGAQAQLEMMKRTPELERLEVFVGSWSREAEKAPHGGIAPSAAKKIVRWEHGGVWMTWEVEIEFTNGQKVHGRRQISWDRYKKAYGSCWTDSQSAHVIRSNAKWTDEKTLEIECIPFKWSDGRTYQFKTQYKLVSPTRIEETGWRSDDGGRYTKHMASRWIKQPA